MERNIKVKALQNSPFLVSLEDSDVIGRGSYAHVVRAFNKEKMEQELAVKIINCKDKETAATITNEINIMKNVPHHPNLVNFIKFQVSSQNNFYLIMEYCEGGNLEKFMLRNKNLFSEEQIQDFMMQFCRGYRVLLQARVIHRDIKPENILLHNGTFKIADFGFAKFIKPEEVGINANLSSKGTPLYMSPELFFGKVGSDKVDIFSLGIVLYRLAFKGSHPFYDETKRFKSIREYGYYMESCPLRFPSKHDRSKELIDLIKRMLEKDKDKRISWLQIFKHPFLKNLDEPEGKSTKLCSNEAFKRKLDVINASVVTCQKSYEDSQQTVKTPAFLMKKNSKIHEKLLRSKKTYTLIQYVSKKLNTFSEGKEYPPYLKGLMKKIAVAALQYALNLVEELQNTSGDWDSVLPSEIKDMETIFYNDRAVLTQILMKITDKKRYLPHEFEELLHDFFTQFGDLSQDLQKPLSHTIVFLLEIYDFLNKYHQEDDSIALESHILEIQSLNSTEACKLLNSSLRKRGLLLV